MNHKSLITALAVGLLSSGSALAASAEGQAAGGPGLEKAGCGGKDGCSGKDGCGKKDDKKEKKD